MWRGRYRLECRYVRNQFGFRSIYLSKYVCIQSTRSFAVSKVDLDIIMSDDRCVYSEHNNASIECPNVCQMAKEASNWRQSSMHDTTHIGLLMKISKIRSEIRVGACMGAWSNIVPGSEPGRELRRIREPGWEWYSLLTLGLQTGRCMPEASGAVQAHAHEKMPHLTTLAHGAPRCHISMVVKMSKFRHISTELPKF